MISELFVEFSQNTFYWDHLDDANGALAMGMQC
jgi:hypothetical protein